MKRIDIAIEKLSRRPAGLLGAVTGHKRRWPVLQGAAGEDGVGFEHFSGALVPEAAQHAAAAEAQRAHQVENVFKERLALVESGEADFADHDRGAGESLTASADDIVLE